MSTIKYHVSYDGIARICTAKDPKDCRAKGIDGEGTVAHFENENEAIKYSEEKNAEKYGKTNSLSKKKKTTPKKKTKAQIYADNQKELLTKLSKFIQDNPDANFEPKGQVQKNIGITLKM